MSYSLISESWLPVVRRDSGAGFIRPAQIVERIETDPVIAINWPRADFRLATLEFLIGLLAVACPPETSREWRRSYITPPDVETLEAAFAPFANVFNLDGDGPRFMQDFEPLAAAPNEAATLLIEAPGEQSIKKNADLLNKRGQVQKLSRAAAAMALYTLQTYAPAGGAGNRTGLRGGGPLTTLVLPSESPTLWQVIWANTPYGKPVLQADWPRVFPWLTRTITSENDRKISPANEENDRLVFWGTPRRVRLVFEKNKDSTTCDLTGQTDEVMVTGWVQRPNGANYTSEAFVHPLTPRYKPKPKEAISFPVHAQPSGIGYKDFVGLLFKTADGTDIPAQCIDTYVRTRHPAIKGDWRLLAAGYDMDNMKARGFVEAELPVFMGDDVEAQAQAVTQLIDGADNIVGILRSSVRNALFSAGAKPDAGATLFATLRARFWEESEADFYKALRSLAKGENRDDVALSFLAALRVLALKMFDEAVPITDSDRPDRVASAARLLGLALRGYGKMGASLFGAFNLAPPETSQKRKKA